MLSHGAPRGLLDPARSSCAGVALDHTPDLRLFRILVVLAGLVLLASEFLLVLAAQERVEVERTKLVAARQGASPLRDHQRRPEVLACFAFDEMRTRAARPEHAPRSVKLDVVALLPFYLGGDRVGRGLRDANEPARRVIDSAGAGDGAKRDSKRRRLDGAAANRERAMTRPSLLRRSVQSEWNLSSAAKDERARGEPWWTWDEGPVLLL